MITVLETADDLQWLRDTHLKHVNDLPAFVFATLKGNEDCPEEISIYKTNDYKSHPMTFGLFGGKYQITRMGDYV